MEEMYLVSRSKLLDLLKTAIMLRSLTSAGVDNWNGYDYALEDYNENQFNEEDLLSNYLKA